MMLTISRPRSTTKTRFLVAFRVVIGICLVALVAILSFFATGFAGWLVAEMTGNAILLYDGGMYLYFISFSIAVVFSFLYFSILKIPRKVLIAFHAAAVLLFGLIFLIQVVNRYDNI